MVITLKNMLRGLSYTALIFCLACQKDVPLIDSVTEQQHNESTIWFGKATKDEISDLLKNYSLSKSGKFLKKEGSKRPVYFFDTKNVVKITDSVGNKMYTLGFGTRKKTESLYNLILGVAPSGELLEPYVARYRPEAGSSDDFFDTKNFENFSGTLNLHRYTDFFEPDAFGKDFYCHRSMINRVIPYPARWSRL